jgi:hypothetical protein
MISFIGSLESAPFVEGKLTGQLGNQMFVIAATISYGLDHGLTPVFPDFVLDPSNDNFLNFENLFYHLNIEIPHGDKILSDFYEESADFSPIPYKENIRIHGYFQSEKYFKDHTKEIIDLFLPSAEIVMYLEEKYGEILRNNKTVSLHMRSYFDHDPDQKVYIQYGRAYFERAFALFSENVVFLVFSNKIKDCKKELAGIDRKFIFIENESHYHDLYLMSMCDHNIISNSSFSWWAAYLNQNPQKIVVAPPKWYAPGCPIKEKDLVPEEWIRISL